MADQGATLLHGKPLESYRVLDLKEELKLRGLSQSGAKAALCTRLREVLSREGAEQQNEVTEKKDVEVVEKEMLAVDDHVERRREEVAQGNVNADSRGPIGNGTEQESDVKTDEDSGDPPVEREGEETHQLDGPQTDEMDHSEQDEKDTQSVTEQKGPKSPGADASEIPVDMVIVQPGTRKRRLVIHKSSQRESEGSVEMPRKKRAWGMSNTSEPQQSSVAISADSLKELIPDEVASAVEKEADVAESDTSNEGEDSDNRQAREGARARRSLSQGDMDITERPSRQKLINLRQQRVSAPGAARIAARGITEAIASTQDASRTRRTPSPARSPVSCILHVTNLVRPFSLPLIKEFLSQKGNLVENGFWIDRIKSHCYAVYSSEDEAQAMRDVMHGLKWPVTSPKFLSVDYATKEEVNRAMGIAEPPPTPPIQLTVPTVPKTEETLVEDRKPSISDDSKPSISDDSPRVTNKTDTRSRLTVDETEVSRPDNVAAAKLLDDLFKKTKSQPAIYWIPLTDEQVLLRSKKRKEEEVRQQRLREERQRQRENEREGQRGEQHGSRNRDTDKERKDQDRSRNFNRERRRSRSRSIDRGRRR